MESTAGPEPGVVDELGVRGGESARTRCDARERRRTRTFGHGLEDLAPEARYLFVVDDGAVWACATWRTNSLSLEQSSGLA